MNPLIAEARRVVLDHKAVASFALIDRLADALEASEAQVARLRGLIINSETTALEDDPAPALAQHARGVLAEVYHGAKWPADLLEAVQALCYGTDHEHIYDVAMCSLCKARVTLVRYGLLEAEHARNA